MEARNEKKKEAPLLIEIGMRLEAIRHNDQVMFSCSKEVYSVGDLLSISDVEIQPGEKPISFSCEVKRIERSNGYQLYGCEIQNISIAEQDRIARAVFRPQQEERKRTVAGMESQQRSLL